MRRFSSVHTLTRRAVCAIYPICIVAFVAICPAVAFGQYRQYQYSQSPSTAVTIPPDWQQKAIPATERNQDFGTVARAAKAEHEFVITNPFSQPMELQSVRTSCGCTTPTIKDKVIQPGETGILHARFNTDRFTGQKRATVVLTIRKPFFTELQFTVGGYIRSDVVITPGEIQFGQLPEGKGMTKELRLDYAGRSDWQLSKITSELPFLKVEAQEVSRQAGRIQYKLIAKIDESAPAGFVASQVILHTNDRRLTSVPLPVSGQIQPNIQFSPQSFALGTLKSGETSAQRLVVKGKKPFKILAVNSEDAEVGYTPKAEAKAAHMLNLTIEPKANSVPGIIEGEVLLQTDLRDQPLRLRLTYEVPQENPPAEVTVSK